MKLIENWVDAVFATAIMICAVILLLCFVALLIGGAITIILLPFGVSL
ncbi:hypothetical protein [Bacillus thuringiensis]|nr:hypothetical protein [Bacillus thuringiensis]MED3275439.1 hypothetical protein [Bacillus thuringiensis]